MNCPICEAPASLLNTVLRYGEGEVYYCNHCKFGFLQDERTQEQLDNYYANEYRTHHGGTDANSIFNADGLKFQKRRWDRYSNFIISDSQEPIKILEIGSSAGQFLSQFENAYNGDMSAFELYGVEPDPICRDYCSKKVPGAVLYDNVNSITENLKFDCIVLFQVFEHVKDPVAFIEKIKSLLKPNGRVVIEVPNLYDALLSSYDIPEYKKIFYHKAHLWYYTPEGLRLFLTNSGFNGKITYIQDYDLKNHVKWIVGANKTIINWSPNESLEAFWKDTSDSYIMRLEQLGISSNVTFIGVLK